MFYQRTLLPRLERELKTKEIVVLTGMRQVGKTSILEYLFNKVNSDNKAMLDAQNPLHRIVFEEQNYDLVLQNLREFGIKQDSYAFVFIDEIQFMPEITQVIKYLYDHHGTKFVVTGSSSYYLRNLFPESLAGRKLTFELYPLTFAEFLTFKKVEKEPLVEFKTKNSSKNKISYAKYKEYYQEYMRYGGFPAVVLEADVQRKLELLEAVFKSYFEIDVKNLADFRQLSKVRDLILLLSSRVGSKLDISKLASELSISRETVYSYLAFLEQTYFISLLPRFSRSIDRTSAGMKKLYLCDTGLANILGQLSEGQQLENAVFQNLLTSKSLHYYAKKSGAEIDFIVDKKYSLEVKRTATNQDIATTKRLTSELKLSESYVVSHKYVDLNGAILAQDL